MNIQLDPLTAQQQRLLDFIFATIENEARQPTIREMGIHMGIKSPNGVLGHFAALEKKGWLERVPKHAATRILRRPDGQKFEGVSFK